MGFYPFTFVFPQFIICISKRKRMCSYMKNREDLACWMHHSMALVGGYLGVYALM